MNINEQTLTFAGICQAAVMVQKIARHNQFDEELFTVMLQGIINTNPKESIDVYGGDYTNLSDGFTMMVAQLGDSSAKKDPELTRYIVSILTLERRLKAKTRVLAELGSRIEQSQRQLAHYEINSDTMLNSFASIYTDIISPLATKIQIAGEPNILKQTANQNRIRALLLAAVRSAVLWRQVGGKRRNILFKRKHFVESAQKMLIKL